MKIQISAISIALLFNACLPKAPKYPYLPVDSLHTEAQKLSDSLSAYIKLWHKGKASANIPERYLPKGYDTGRYVHFRLLKPEDVKPENIWISRPAHNINFNHLYGSFPDPHCTYLLMPLMYAPFNSSLIIEGEFPYCRFFSIQASPPFDAREYRYDKWAGKGEVGIVDADIIPNLGHTNPFLPNALRRLKNRSYQIKFIMTMGDASKIEPSHKPPFYRAKGNTRYASGIQYQGPWGMDKKNGHGRGIWDFGDIWIRYYGIDNDKMPIAGVDFPKAYFELNTGEKFLITADFPGLIKASETTMANREVGNSDPGAYNGPEQGWDKQFGIFLQIATGGSRALYRERKKDKAYIRNLDLGVTGRGENQAPPASYEPHATGSNYTHYLTSGIAIKRGKVFIITGQLPTFPDTELVLKF
jgi:hypothetical protein